MSALIQDIVQYAKKRMSDLGYDAEYCHYEPFRVQNAAASVRVLAYNEYYYLISPSVPASLVIISDTDIFSEGAAYPGFSFFGAKEHSGLLEISQAAGSIDLEFIRVIPE